MSVNLETLKHLYASFEKETGKNFFNKFYDYFSFVKSRLNLDFKITKIIKEKEIINKKMDNLEYEAMQEVLSLRDKIKKSILKKLKDKTPSDGFQQQSSKTINERIDFHFEQIDKLTGGTLTYSGGGPAFVIRSLLDILELMSQTGNKKFGLHP